MTVLQSKTVALAAMQQTRLAERTDFAGPWVQSPNTDLADLSPAARDHLLQRFQKNLKVEIVPKTDILSIQFRAKDPRIAAEVVNATVSSYTERNFRNSYDAASQVSQLAVRRRWTTSETEGQPRRRNSHRQSCRSVRGLIGVDETDNIVTDKLKGI